MKLAFKCERVINGHGRHLKNTFQVAKYRGGQKTQAPKSDFQMPETSRQMMLRKYVLGSASISLRVISS